MSPLVMVSTQHRGHFLLATTQRIRTQNRMVQDTEFSSFNYFLSALSHLQKVFIDLARLARALQFLAQAQRKAL